MLSDEWQDYVLQDPLWLGNFLKSTTHLILLTHRTSRLSLIRHKCAQNTPSSWQLGKIISQEPIHNKAQNNTHSGLQAVAPHCCPASQESAVNIASLGTDQNSNFKVHSLPNTLHFHAIVKPKTPVEPLWIGTICALSVSWGRITK